VGYKIHKRWPLRQAEIAAPQMCKKLYTLICRASTESGRETELFKLATVRWEVMAHYFLNSSEYAIAVDMEQWNTELCAFLNFS
jgi:hypothetical protein